MVMLKHIDRIYFQCFVVTPSKPSLILRPLVNVQQLQCCALGRVLIFDIIQTLLSIVLHNLTYENMYFTRK